MSRLQPSSSSGSPLSGGGSAQGEYSPTGQRGGQRAYPSWLPTRPPPPDPGSTLHSSIGMPETGLTPTEPFAGGRKPTPRSIRVVSLQDAPQTGRDRSEPADRARASNSRQARVWSRATTAGLDPTLVSAAVDAHGRIPRPRFRSVGLHPELLRNPSIFGRIYFYLLPLLAFYHLPLQTFFDFNAVYMLLQVAKYPNPVAPGVSGSGKNWALGAAAYIACWLVWIMVVFVLYELVYSFYRRWRVRRPLIVPLYLSSSGFNFVSMTSYTNFCFMQYIRFSAFFGENGSLRDGLAETFWFYSQNLPTVALLLPRAGLVLTLLFVFSYPNPEYVAMAEAGFSPRDRTFFRASDGTLTSYARGVLIANAAWTAWRILVLIISWTGLWILSGQGCAGICGPRYRWEEEEHEKTMSTISDSVSDGDALPWVWRMCTRLRIQEAYNFCLTVKPSRSEEGGDEGMLGVSTTPAFDVEQVLAAIGLPSAPTPARRAPISGDFFEPKKGGIGMAPTPPPELSDIIPKVVRKSSTERPVAGPSAPLMKLPYPFTGYGAQASPKDQIPFPPSPGSRKEKRRSPTSSSAGPESEEDAEEEEGEEDEEEEDPRTSGSLSSLGQPIMSRYPFQFRRPHGRGGSVSSGPATRSTPQSDEMPSSNTRSSHSQSTRSTGNQETSSESPMSHGVGSSVMSSPASGHASGSPIPMPPRHPQPGRGRARAGTVPTSYLYPTSPSPVISSGRNTDNLGSGYEGRGSLNPKMMEQPEPEGPHEAAEGEDSVGLLGVMPRTRRRRGRRDSRSNSHSSQSDSQSRSASSRSRAGSAVRSRTQSLIQSLSAASRSSLDVVQAIRSRTSSMARLEEDPGHISDSRSHSGSAGSGSGSARSATGEPLSSSRLRPASSTPSIATTSAFTARPDAGPREHSGERSGIAIPAGRGESRPDISTAAQSFVTAPTTLAGTVISDQAPSWPETMVDKPQIEEYD
ncbi:hypothetical protein F5J12DRAFT_905195 [Pisolithus orientalis]|uniref:uncharacterized protein n=1 Tax=Pisolithus orientalis TaxID=936130 RepID=UPI002224B540|nr:uncharacterized protein F5J12DRAFT_905195 [Pisolithus orientalis]KAI6008835.1 hypothetical protein F5J12DRAFT_905195 [Pisolithus orientalis]